MKLRAIHKTSRVYWSTPSSARRIHDRHWRVKVMASIQRLGKGRWRARWRDPLGRQKAKTFTHKNLADKYLKGVGMAMQASTYVDPGAGHMSVEVFAAKWISTQGHLKPSTLATYERIPGKHVLPRWGSTPLARVAHEDVAAWVTDLIASDLSAATVRYVYRVFHCCSTSR